MKTGSYWQFTETFPEFPSLTNDLSVDVVVIGGGLTGITTAWLLKQAKVKVALLDRQRCAQADTGHTTAHLTYVTDARLHHLVKVFGRDAAQAFWEAGAAGIDQIDEIVRQAAPDSDFEWVRGYLHAKVKGSDDKDLQALKQDAQLAGELGFGAEWLESVPFVNQPGIEFAHQAKFHPFKYLKALVSAIPGEGCHVFENSEAREIDDLKLGQGKILRLDGRKVAAYRDPTGKVSLHSPVCTHLKCIVRWNDADQTWDCPCHGSRFKPDGEVLSGPAEEPLEKVELPEEKLAGRAK